MVETRQVQVKAGDVLLLVGTMKGVFLLRSGAARTRWDVAGPFFAGQSIYALAWDGRAGRRRIWVGTTSSHWGPGLSFSDDFGRTWDAPERTRIRFPQDTGATLARVWQIQPGRAEEPDVLYAGVEPAALFESRDGGETWELVRGLWDHPHRAKWTPGFGGLGLHTILPDPANPRRILVAISTGGVYRSDDGGRSWQVRNQGVRADFLPDKYPEFGQCVHKVARHPARPDRLFLQNHWGLYRSDDAGDSWRDIARGVPSDFGFAMVSHPHDPDVVYIVPMESDAFRCAPGGKLRVYRTRDAGRSWEPLARGLPQKDAFETVLRDSMDCDRLNPAGVYFGTRSGKLFGSADGGASWSLLAGHLPGITCVRAALVGERAAGRRARSAGVGRKVARRSPPGSGRKAGRAAAPRRAAKKAAPRRRAVASKTRSPRRGR